MVGESDAGSGFGTETSWRMSDSGIVDDTGTAAREAYRRAYNRGICFGVSVRGKARRTRR